MESVEEALHNSYSSTDSQLAPPMKVALLQAAPLVIGRDAKAVDQLDLKHERDTVLDALRKTRKHMHVSCDFCTTRRLRELMTEGCRILHYSGHGFSFIDRNGQPQARLAFENGEGGTHELEVKNLTDLVAAGAEADGAPPLDFAFISACHSVGGGEAFVRAGVPHVVAVRREAQLQDVAACEFATAFYYALFNGRTVKQAFEIGQQAVANCPKILRAGTEADKFLLLPEDGEHGVALCREMPDGPLVDVSPTPSAHNLPAFFPLEYIGRHADIQQLVMAATGQQKRLLSLVGPAGVGKTSLAVAAANYMYERSCFSGGVFFVSVAGASSAAELTAAVLAALTEAGCHTSPALQRRASEDVEPVSSDDADGGGAGRLAAVLRERGPCLLLIDNLLQGGAGAGAGAGAAESAALPLLQQLLQRASELRLLVTSTAPVTELPGVAQRQILLQPMAAEEAAKLFKSLAPRPIKRDEVGCDDPEHLKQELKKLFDQLGAAAQQLGAFGLVQDPSVTTPALKVQWTVENHAQAARLHQLLTSRPSRFHFELPPVSASGRAAVYGQLALPRMLAAHPALASLEGNPKAIALAVSLLMPDAQHPRKLHDVAALLQREDAGGADVPDACRATLERLHGLLRPASPPPPGGATPPPDRPPAPGSPEPGGGNDMQMAPPARAAGERAANLPAALRLRSHEVKDVTSRAGPWLGSGSFGSVYASEYQGVKVAMKKFFDNSGGANAFAREAALLAELRHPHVVQLIKVCAKPFLMIVTELLVCSLHALLHGSAGGRLRDSLLCRAAVPSICSDIARGMHYLHSFDPPVLHRNLKSQNLLLDSGGKVKVCDFGWARFQTVDSGRTFFNSWQWVAPEILAGGRFNEKADVYSFAMVAWEVLTRSLPFTGMNPVQIGMAVGQQRLRPPLPDDCPAGFGTLLSDCWHHEPEQRHRFDVVLGKLQAMETLNEFDDAECGGVAAMGLR